MFSFLYFYDYFDFESEFRNKNKEKERNKKFEDFITSIKEQKRKRNAARKYIVIIFYKL